MSTPIQIQTYTAAQLAPALGYTKRAVQQRLDGAPGAVLLPGRGGIAKSWPLHALPAEWQTRLAAKAESLGHRNVEHYLKDLTAPWQPRDARNQNVPLAKIDQRWIDRATHLRDALAEPLRRQHEFTDDRPGLIALGVAEFIKAARTSTSPHVQKSICGKHWENLFKRTIHRDRGNEDWNRLEIYLHEPAFRMAAPPKPSPTRSRFNHQKVLDPIMEALSSKTEPSTDDRAWLFHESFRHFEALLTEHTQDRDRRAVKATLLEYLISNVKGISTNLKSLRTLFDIKLVHWREGGPPTNRDPASSRTIDALRDHRPKKSGNHRRPDFAADEKRIRDLAIQLDGNESLAHTMLRERGQLSQEFCDHYHYDPRTNKSAMPRTVRDNITPAVEFALPLRHSERAFRLAGPWTDRDWSDVTPGDWFNADDVTWNHLFKVRNPDGSWDVLRGECLLMLDAKSDYPIVPLLIAGHYNSEHPVRLTLRTHDTVGMPRKGLIFERGIWSGKLVKSLGAGAIRPGETIRAFAQAMPGLRIHRAWTPRAKPIEGALHHLQDRMRCIFGFVGFNEQVEKREDIQKLIARARRGDPEALACFLTQDEWMRKIVEVLDDYRHSPQNGKRLQGQSPAEAWNAAMKERPLKQLSDDTRYLLATHCVETDLKPEGIVLPIRGHRRCYIAPETGAWHVAGVKKVLAYYNVEKPDLLIVYNLKRTQFFTARSPALPAMGATRAQLAEVAALKRAHMAPAREIFGSIPHAVVSNIVRDDAHDETTKETGRVINAAVEAHKAEESAQSQMERRARNLCDQLGERCPDFATWRGSLPGLLETLEWKLGQQRNHHTNVA